MPVQSWFGRCFIILSCLWLLCGAFNCCRTEDMHACPWSLSVPVRPLRCSRRTAVILPAGVCCWTWQSNQRGTGQCGFNQAACLQDLARVRNVGSVVVLLLHITVYTQSHELTHFATTTDSTGRPVPSQNQKCQNTGTKLQALAPIQENSLADHVFLIYRQTSVGSLVLPFSSPALVP